MGLLARASREAGATHHRPLAEGQLRSGRIQSGLTVLPALERGSIRKLASELPGKSDFLGILIENFAVQGTAEESRSALVARLRQALGPSCELYVAGAGVLAFAGFKGEWDPEIYERQLRLSLRLSLGPERAEALKIRIDRFAKDAPISEIEDEVAKFAGI